MCVTQAKKSYPYNKNNYIFKNKKYLDDQNIYEKLETSLEFINI